MINAKAIDHVCLWVKSLSETKNYYKKIIGVVCTPRDGDENTLVVESENIHFFISESKNEYDFIPKQHLSFEVESIDHVVNTLDEFGISDYVLGEVNFFIHRNYRWCEWRDPNGIRLECVEML